MNEEYEEGLKSRQKPSFAVEAEKRGLLAKTAELQEKDKRIESLQSAIRDLPNDYKREYIGQGKIAYLEGWVKSVLENKE